MISELRIAKTGVKVRAASKVGAIPIVKLILKMCVEVKAQKIRTEEPILLIKASKKAPTSSLLIKLVGGRKINLGPQWV